MYNKKSLFITFEGIEGSGKSYQSKKLFRKIKNMKLPVIYTREPGGTRTAEKIRKVILEDYFHPDSKEKFNKYTDTLLYLAARNEHIKNKIKPAISKKKIIKVVFEYEGPIPAPIKKGDTLGLLNVYVSDELKKQINILAAEDIEKSNIFSRIFKSLNYLVWGDV